MADYHHTPESKPMKSTATVTPTMHLSEGPLTPFGGEKLLFSFRLQFLFIRFPSIGNLGFKQ